MKNPILIAAVVALVVGAAAFFGGMKFAQTKASGAAGHNQPVGQGEQFRGRFGNGQPIRGEIISSDDGSITVKMQDGSSKIVLLSDTTEITEATAAQKESLTTGKQVLVLGTSNSDGSVTAQNIQLNPRGGFGQSDHQGNEPQGSPR